MAFISSIASSALPGFLPAGMPLQPGPAHFWAILVWVVIPSVLTIWLTYHHQQERLCRMQRRMRQLEARLAGHAALSQKLPEVASPVSFRNVKRPSTLTTCVLLPAAPAAEPGSAFARPAVEQVL